jgi:nitroimidazol reductase NimA-like FMN-containing flavoprotein (pyridoxamine 5'-phosphate oxidase superfamily)
LYWHAHSKARNVAASTAQTDKVCINVCLLDGLVLARSAFNHSVNYRSVTLFGVPELITDPVAKETQFKNMLEKFSPGRWPSLRPITDGEIQATGLARIPISEVSAKVRAEGVGDNKADLDWPVWAGIVPLVRNWANPCQDPGQTDSFASPTLPPL